MILEALDNGKFECGICIDLQNAFDTVDHKILLKPSRFTESSATLIGNIYGNNISQETISGNILIQLADHLAQFIRVEKR